MPLSSVPDTGEQQASAEHQGDNPGRPDMWLLWVLLLLLIQGEWGWGFRREHFQSWGRTSTGPVPGEMAEHFTHPDTYSLKKHFLKFCYVKTNKFCVGERK